MTKPSLPAPASEADIQRICACLSAASGQVYMLGIGGFGMAGLAALIQARGFQVSGSDPVENRLTDWLKSRGVEVFADQKPEHLERAVNWVVRSTAVSLEHPVVRAAGQAGLPVFLRGETLAALTRDRSTVAIAGTHGKTTTSAMIAQVLDAAGRNPDFCIGGEVDCLGGVARTAGGETLVLEADESDGTLVHYRPKIGVITNIEFDHMEYFDDESAFLRCFDRFAAQIGDRLYLCSDQTVPDRFSDLSASVRTYGLSEGAAWRAEVLDEDASGTRFEVSLEGACVGALSLPVPGRHNVVNALAATAVAMDAGCAFEAIQDGIRGFEPVRRRFEKIHQGRRLRGISDYAHHPTEIRAVVEAARWIPAEKRIAVFQPHRYSRTRQLLAEFPPAFEGLDEVVLTPVYAASENPLPGGTGEDLFRACSDQLAIPVRYCETLEEAWGYLKERVSEADLLMILGAGDVEKISEWAREAWNA